MASNFRIMEKVSIKNNQFNTASMEGSSNKLLTVPLNIALNKIKIYFINLSRLFLLWVSINSFKNLKKLTNKA
jgi:hypothetical protein